jgi:hypothetical protein
MVTVLSLTVLATILLIFSIGMLVVGITKKVDSVAWIGALTLIILTALAICYFAGWMIPVIAILGVFAFGFTIIGTSGEESEESFKFGLFYLAIGLFLFFNAFLLWYDTGHYTSMAFGSWFLCFTFVINAMHCHKDFIPVLSMGTALLFALLAIYLWMMLGLNGMPIFWSGTFAAIFARSIWWLIYGRKEEADSLIENAN